MGITMDEGPLDDLWAFNTAAKYAFVHEYCGPTVD